MAVDTYYFDVSDAGPTDIDGAFTNDANAFDGSTSTSASTSSVGTTDENYLRGDGTNAPASGGTISQVRARLYATSSSGTRSATIYTSTNESIGTATQTSAVASWGSYTTLSTPTGGWDWSKVQSLYVKLYGSDVSFPNFFYRAEIEVTSSSTGRSSITSRSSVSSRSAISSRSSVSSRTSI